MILDVVWIGRAIVSQAHVHQTNQTTLELQSKRMY